MISWCIALLKHITSLTCRQCSRFQEQQLFANTKNYVFTQWRIEYLGHITSKEDDVFADPNKVQAMFNWSILKSLRALRGFLRLTRYYRCFIANYSRIAWPLTQQLKDAFLYNEEATQAFQQLKHAMTSLPILGLQTFLR